MFIEFGRRVTYQPLFNSILVSLISGWLVGLFSQQIVLGLGAGLLVFISMFFIYYPLYLTLLYGAWRLGAGYLYYLDLQHYSAKLVALLFPNQLQYKALPLTAIKSVIVRHQPMSFIARWTGTFALYIPWLRPTYFVQLETKQQTVIQLDLAWDQIQSGQKANDKINLAIETLEEMA